MMLSYTRVLGQSADVRARTRPVWRKEANDTRVGVTLCDFLLEEARP